LSLIDFLRNSHPERLSDSNFISARTEAATETYEQAVKNGYNTINAEELANEILFNGLHFSRYDTIVNILWIEFSDIIPENEASEYAIKLLTECKYVFEKYPIYDNFAYDPEFDLLYSELTGTIAIYLEEHELQ
jgi:hypothetical protein